MNLNQTAPAAVAPKGTDFISFLPFPEDGPVILTILGFNFTKDYVNTKQDGTTEVFDALEFILGTNTTVGPRFIKTWPAKYSIHEKSNYSKLYKAATGKLPVAGSNAADLLGKGIQADLANENKTARVSGKAYVSTRIKGIGPVMKQLLAEIVPQASLMGALKVALTPKDKQENSKAVAPSAAGKTAPASSGPDEDVPF